VEPVKAASHSFFALHLQAMGEALARLMKEGMLLQDSFQSTFKSSGNQHAGPIHMRTLYAPN
jgi:hypothetical protein